MMEVRATEGNVLVSLASSDDVRAALLITSVSKNKARVIHDPQSELTDKYVYFQNGEGCMEIWPDTYLIPRGNIMGVEVR